MNLLRNQIIILQSDVEMPEKSGISQDSSFMIEISNCISSLGVINLQCTTFPLADAAGPCLTFCVRARNGLEGLNFTVNLDEAGLSLLASSLTAQFALAKEMSK